MIRKFSCLIWTSIDGVVFLIKIRDLCQKVARIQVTDPSSGEWSWGSGFWATDGTKTKFLTAAHIFKINGKIISYCNIYYELPDGTSHTIVNVSVVFPGGDMAQLDIHPPSGVFPFLISKKSPPPDALLVNIGYGGSLNQYSSGAPGVNMPLNDIHVMLSRGRFVRERQINGVNFLEIRALIESGFSGGPIFSLSDSSGEYVVDAGKTNERELIGTNVFGLCSGLSSRIHDTVSFQMLDIF